MTSAEISTRLAELFATRLPLLLNEEGEDISVAALLQIEAEIDEHRAAALADGEPVRLTPRESEEIAAVFHFEPLLLASLLRPVSEEVRLETAATVLAQSGCHCESCAFAEAALALARGGLGEAAGVCLILLEHIVVIPARRSWQDPDVPAGDEGKSLLDAIWHGLPEQVQRNLVWQAQWEADQIAALEANRWMDENEPDGF